MELEENQYIYCLVHKKCLMADEISAHEGNTCEFVIRNMVIRKTQKSKKLWMAKTIVQKEGMRIYSPPPVAKVLKPTNTLPPNAIIMDVHQPIVRLDNL